MRWTTKAGPALMGAALAMTMAATASAQEGRPMPHGGNGTIRVTAEGEARVAPDRAWADFGVETQAATAREAAAENARLMEAIIAGLVRTGVARADIETSGYNVFPDYAPPVPGQEGEPRVRGYRVINTVTARTDDVSRVGAVIDAALAAGANRVNGVRFGLRNPETARAAALRDAIRRARADAQVIAEGLGVQLGDVRDAGTTTYRGGGPVPVPVMLEARQQMDMAAATPVQAGEQTVTATVNLVFAIR